VCPGPLQQNPDSVYLLSSSQVLQIQARLSLALFEKSNSQNNFSCLQIGHFLLTGIGFSPASSLDINGLSELTIGELLLVNIITKFYINNIRLVR
jgi:hypothetical protein